MKTAMDIINEINDEKKAQKPGIVFWVLLSCGSFICGVIVAMIYAYIMCPYFK